MLEFLILKTQSNKWFVRYSTNILNKSPELPYMISDKLFVKNDEIASFFYTALFFKTFERLC